MKINKPLAFIFFLMIFSGVSVMAVHYWGKHDEHMIAIGRDQMHQQLLDAARDKALMQRDMSLKIKAGIEKGLSDSDKAFSEKEASRIADGKLSRDNIELLIQENPDYYTNRLCVVPDNMLAQRNHIRQNGAE